MTSETIRCSANVIEAGQWPRYHQCERKASVTEDGAPWCKTHAPSSVKARQQKAAEPYARKWEIEKGKYEAPRLRAEVARLTRERDAALEALSGTRLTATSALVDGGDGTHRYDLPPWAQAALRSIRASAESTITSIESGAIHNA
jgi:hypothetical protein